MLLTQFAGQAWEKLCATYDFEASARRIGLLMTIDGSGDDAIQTQGITEKYTFSDADGGPAGAESDVEEDEEDLADVAEGGEEEGEDAEDAEDAMEGSDEEDDTTEWMVACGVAPPQPPVA